MTEDPDDASPQTFGSYTLLRELGSGGQGTVWLAEDQRLKREVALKVLSGGPPGAIAGDRLARFRREAEAAARLDDAHICALLDAGEVDGVPYLAFRFVAGETLAERIARAYEQREGHAPREGAPPSDGGTTDPSSREGIQRIVRTFEKIARALHKAHERGLIHRDVKPGNVMITPDGEPVLLDFGLARDELAEEHTLTHSGDLLGTPAYMSPEQLMAHRVPLDRRTDVYSLGATLYEALTLRRPYAAATRAELYQQILHATPPSASGANRQIPRDLQVVLETAMEKDRNRRYQTAQDLAEDLRRFRDFEPIRAKPIGSLLRVRRWAQRNPALAVGLAAVVLLLASGFAIRSSQLADTRAALRHSEMLRLVVTSEQVAEDDPLAAMELALRAVDIERSLESVAQVRRVLAQPLPEARVDIDRQALWRLRLSPAGDRILCAAGGSETPYVVFRDGQGGELARHAVPEVELGFEACAFSPTGRYVHVLGRDGDLQLFSGDGHPVGGSPRETGVHACVWLPDDRLVLARSGDGRVEILDPGTGRRETLRVAGSAPATTNLVVAGASGDVLFGTRTSLERCSPRGVRVAALDGLASGAARLAVGADGAVTAACLDDGALVFWDSRVDAKSAPRVEDATSTIDVVASPDGERFLTYHHGGPLRLWDRTGAAVAALSRPDGRALSPVVPRRLDLRSPFRSDGERLVTVYSDRTVCVWDRDGTRLAALGGFSGSTEQVVGWLRSGGLFLGHATHVRVCDADGRVTTSLRHEQNLTSILELPDGDLWIGDASSVLRWNLAGLPFFRAHGDGYSITERGASVWTAGTGFCRQWRLDGQQLAEFGPFDRGCGLEDEGRWIAARVDDDTVRLHRTEGSGSFDVADPDLSTFRSVIAWEGDAPRVAIVHRSGRAYLSDLDGAPPRTLDLGGEAFDSVRRGDLAFTALSGVQDPQGAVGVFGSGICTWTADTGPIDLLWLPERWCLSVRLSADGRALAAGAGNSVWLWERDRPDGPWREPAVELRGHDASYVWDLDFSSDGSLLASGGEDGTVRIWSVADRECVQILRGHERMVSGVRILPGDREAVSIGDDGMVRRWLLDDDEVLARARRVPRADGGTDSR